MFAVNPQAVADAYGQILAMVAFGVVAYVAFVVWILWSVWTSRPSKRSTTPASR